MTDPAVPPPPPRPLRLEHRLCGYVTTLPAEMRTALTTHPHRHPVFCDGCARTLRLDEFVVLEDEP